MYAERHCRHCRDKHFKGAISFKKRTDEYIYDYTRSYVSNRVDEGDSFTAEGIAREILVKTHKVRQALHKLNLEGIVTQKKNHAPHDSKRDWWHGGSDSSWMASFYYKVVKQDESSIEE